MEPCVTPGGGEGPLSAEAVADLLETVYRANARLAAEVDAIIASRSSVSLALLNRFTLLGSDLRPGAQARAELAGLDPVVLLAGARLWVARGRSGQGPARQQASRRWTAGGGA